MIRLKIKDMGAEQIIVSAGKPGDDFGAVNGNEYFVDLDLPELPENILFNYKLVDGRLIMRDVPITYEKWRELAYGIKEIPLSDIVTAIEAKVNDLLSRVTNLERLLRRP